MAIAALVVSLKAETASFASGMQRASRITLGTAKDIERSLGIIAKASAAAAIAVAAGTAAMVKASLETADKMYKLSQQTGVNIETLSGLSHAAKLSGVDIDSLATALGRLNRNLFDAAGGKGDAAAAFKTLGINVRDASGQLKSGDAVLGEIAEKFAQFKDGSTKSALAIQIFGRAGAQLIPLLNGGKAGLAAMRAEAERLGIVIDSKTGAAAEKFNDDMERMQIAVKGAALQFTAGLLPALNDLVAAFARTQEKSDTFQKLGETIGNGMKFAASALIGFQLAVETYIVKMQKLEAFDRNQRRKTLFGGLLVGGRNDDLSDFDRQIAALEQQAAASLARLDGVGAGIANVGSASSVAAPSVENLGDAFKFAGEHAFKAASMFDIIPPTLKTLEERINALPLSKMDALTDAWKRQAKAIEEHNEVMKRGEDITRAVRTAKEVYSDTIADLTDLLNEGAISEETFGRAAKDAADTMDQANKKTTDFTRVIGSALEDAILHFKNIKGILAGLLEDIARIILRVTITKPFEDWLTGVFGNAGSGGGGSSLSGLFSGISGLFSGIFGKGGEFAQGFGGILGAINGGLSKALKNIFGGFRAGGGPVVPGRSYVVGEKRAELFTPSVAGYISPQASGGGTTNIKIDARGAAAGVEHNITKALDALEDRVTRRVIGVIGQRQMRYA